MRQADWDTLSLAGALSTLERPGTELDFWQSRSAYPPWQLTAADFLGFARTDLRTGSRRGLVNAVGNLKRALHCQTDTVLCAAGLLEIATARRWNFTVRLEVLREMAIVAPRILARINSVRNEVEHEYAVPPPASYLSDFADVIELFIGLCEPFARAGFEMTEWRSTYRGADRSLSVAWDGSALVIKTFSPHREVTRLASSSAIARADASAIRSAVTTWYRACVRVGAMPQP